MKQTINFTLNKEPMCLDIDVRKSLLEVLREDCGLTGTKEGCSVGECGACTLIVDDTLIDSCIYLGVWADGKNITSIEGITNTDGTLSDIQQSYVDSGAVQCGFCTPGLVMSSTYLLNKNSNPTQEEIRRGMSGNICRCTGYQKVIEAVENTVAKRKQ